MSSEQVRHTDPTRLSAMLAPELPVPPWQPGELAAVLRHQLAAPLDFAAPSVDDPSGRPGPPKPEGVSLPPGSPQTFGALLFDSNPPIDLLIQTKAFAKPFVVTPTGVLPREVAAVLYYGSIVAARTRHGHRISELDDASLRYGLEGMVRCEWLDDSSRRLMEDGLRSLTPG